MRSERIEVQYRLHFYTAFHFGTGLRAGLIHRGIARNANGFLYVPGSTFKGVLRDYATRLAHLLQVRALEPHNIEADVGEFAPRSDIVAHIFGSRWLPGTLFFDDALLCNEDRDFFKDQPNQDQPDRFMTKQSEVRTQVSMSRVTGTARRDLLFSSEYGIPELRFDGAIYGILAGPPLIDDPAKTYALILLLAALRSIDCLGGNKSAGAGRVMCEITRLRVDDTSKDVQEYLNRLSEFEFYELAEGEEL